VECGGELDVKLGVIFRRSVMAVGFFSHFDVGNGVAALFDVGDLSDGIFGCAVNHGDGNHRG